MRASFVGSLGVLAAQLVSTAAFAQSDENVAAARQSFEQGTAAYEAGEFDIALTHFRHAHELTNSPDILYNIATVADRARHDEEALAAYQEFLEARPRTEDRAHIEGRIRVLEQAVARPDEPPPEEVRTEVVYVDRVTGAQSEGPGALPWIVAIGGGALMIAGGAMTIVSALDISAVENPGAEAQWTDFESRYDRARLIGPVGGVFIGVGAVAALTGILWAVLRRNR